MNPVADNTINSDSDSSDDPMNKRISDTQIRPVRRWVRGAGLFGLIALLISVPLLAQREVNQFRVGSSEELIFDTNERPLARTLVGDLNYSPSVVYSSDSKTGFVNLPNSNQVAAFDVQTAQLIQMIEVRENPMRLTLTPDGTRIVVPCIFIDQNAPDAQGEVSSLGAISIIDIDTFQVRSIDMQDTVFSVTNNVVVSPDGRTGFVGSAGTDEIIRFDIESATEISPRIFTGEGTRPASATMAHDGSFFGVVLVGSNGLPVRETPDSIVLIETGSFQESKRLSFEVEETDIPYNFRAGNNVAFSNDGQVAMIAEQGASAAAAATGLPAGLIPDRALLIDVAENEIIQEYRLGTGTGLDGGAAAGTFTTPDGQFFIILTFLNIHVIEIETQTNFAVAPRFSEFEQSTRVVFTPDSELMYVGSPVTDRLVTFRPATGEVTNFLRMGGNVTRVVDGNNITVASGPLDTTITPDGTRIATVNFNANTVQLFEPTFAFTSVQLIAENERFREGESEGEVETIPAGDRFFTGIAVSNYGEADAEVIFTALNSFGLTIDLDFDLIVANPNPIPVCTGLVGATTLSWNTTGIAETVEVRIGSRDGEALEIGTDEDGDPSTIGEPIGEFETGSVVEDGTEYFLLDAPTGAVLDTVTVFLSDLGCSASSQIVAFPNPIQVCDGGLGQTTVFWDITGVQQEVQVRIDAPDGQIFVDGGPEGSNETGTWVRDGMEFFLLDKISGTVLDSTVVNLTSEGCGPNDGNNIENPATIAMAPDTQVNFTTNSFLRPNLAFGNLVGWLDLDSDASSLAGIFLSFDGDLNRLDGAPIAPKSDQFVVFPELRLTDGFLTEIDIVNPNSNGITLLFDLFNTSGTLVASTLRTLLGQNRRVYAILGDPDDPASIGIFDPLLGGLGLLIATPNPIQVCEDANGLGETTLSWDVTDRAEEIEIRKGSPTGEVVTSGEATGSFDTGLTVEDRTLFFLLNAANGEVLDRVLVTHNEFGCPPPLISANPNPILVCDGGLGATTLSWDAGPGVETVEIRAGSAEGEVLASDRAPSGTFNTGRIVPDGETYLLIDTASANVLDTVVVNLTRDGCLMEGDEIFPGFTDGYLRVAGLGFASVESLRDKSRLAVLAGQLLESEELHFNIPHFSAFQGSETILALVYPSSTALGGFLPADDEGEPVEPEKGPPMTVTLSLRGNDGAELGEPVVIELLDGEMFEGRVTEIFGLEDTGALQSGWIDIISDVPGLLGAAQIEVFGSEGLTMIPLQAAQESILVFPHVAQGLGFTTGVSLVNSGDQPAEVTVEVRTADGNLVGTLGPTILQPGSRIVGTLPELVPGAGEVIGGTIKVLSDQPVSGLVLFFDDAQRVISAVPGQGVRPE